MYCKGIVKYCNVSGGRNVCVWNREIVREGFLEEIVFKLKFGLKGIKFMKNILGNLEMLYKDMCG